MSDYQLNMDAYKLADLTFHLMANCLAKEEKVAASHNIKQAEYRCLRAFENDECLNNNVLAKRLHLSPSRLTRIVTGLISKGYLSRSMNFSDKRYIYLQLSPQGKEVVKEVNQAYVRIHREILSNIETEQHAPLITAMNHFLKALEKWIAAS